MAVRTKTKRKPAKRVEFSRRRENLSYKHHAAVAPAPIAVTVQRRKLVDWRSGEVHCDPAGNVVTWDSTDPAAEVALMAKAAGGVGWALVPADYQFVDLGAVGKVWR